METASPNSKGELLRGAEDEGEGRPCYRFAEGDGGNRPVLADGTRPSGPAGYVSLLRVFSLVILFLPSRGSASEVDLLLGEV